MGVSQQFALSATTKYRRPEDISVPSQLLCEAYGDLVHVRHNRSVSNLTGIAPLLPIPTQELAGELPKVLHLYKLLTHCTRPTGLKSIGVVLIIAFIF